MAFLLLRISRFNFHCYTQREATPTQKSTWVWQLWPFVTSCAKDYKGHSLTNANKFGWTAQYPTMCNTALCSGHTYMGAIRKRLTRATNHISSGYVQCYLIWKKLETNRESNIRLKRTTNHTSSGYVQCYLFWKKQLETNRESNICLTRATNHTNSGYVQHLFKKKLATNRESTICLTRATNHTSSGYVQYLFKKTTATGKNNCLGGLGRDEFISN